MEWNRSSLKKLIKVGTPMFLVTNIYGKWPLLQRTVIVVLGGSKALGLFTLAFMVEKSFKIFSDSISNVTYPNMTRDWGKGKTVGEIIKRNLFKPFLIIVPTFLFLIIGGYYLIPFFINSFLPKYLEVIYASQIMLIVGFLNLFFVFGNIYNVINDQKERLKMYIFGIFSWSLILIFIYRFKGFSLEIFPIALIVGNIIIILVNINYIKKNWYKTKN
ncbi:lipopolysaccharide biosynthesis protein [Calditrichota bacterium GD2]